VTTALLALFALVIVAQARFPEQRLPLVLAGAAFALVVLTAAGGDARAVLVALPWDVLIILGALGVVSQVLALSQVFTRAAVFLTRAIGASPARLIPVAAGAMFAISGLVNNITALVLVLPVVLAILQLAGTTERHLRWTLGTLLVACNLGGAATPIGDFPAVLLLGAGAMDFTSYLRLAFPTAVVALVVFVALVVLVARPARDVPIDALRRRITVAVVDELHARIRLRRRHLVPAVLVLLAMLAGWTLLPSSTVPPHLVAWVGAGVLLLTVGRKARAVLEAGVDVDATLFLFGLLVLVGAVRESGLFGRLAETLASSTWAPTTQLAVFVTVAGVATGFFSAGPSMAAMLEVATPLAERLGPGAVYLGLAFGVCAGSSLLLTAATSGPLAQSMVERAGLTDVGGRRVVFSFASFLPVGIVAFAVILLTGISASLWVAQ
jgi:Na+/H+ antiporter NhaD/arsenite permease-like protein